jgi:hypothetical protein
MGTHTFVRARVFLHQPSSIWQATFLVVLRQEIVIAFRTQRPVELLREYIEADRSLSRTDDWALSFRIIVLCAEILNFCYGEEPKTVTIWDDLAGRTRLWMEAKPASFEPFLHRRADSESALFPQMWLLNDCHGTSRTFSASNLGSFAC